MPALHHNDQFSVVYGQKTIAFGLQYCERKTLEISVHPDGIVMVKAPAKADFAQVEKKVMKRAGWILRQQNYFRQFEPKMPKRCYVSGETHLYLGRHYRLKLAVGQENSVKLSRGVFLITCRDKLAPEEAKKLLNQWYAEKAGVQFAQSMQRCWQKFKKLGIAKPRLSTKRMQKRWGSLSANRTVTLNTELVKAPKECIDYVVTHELCHLKYNDHSRQFYRLLASVLPDWEKIKHRLELSMA
ncbi:MAG: putative metal-dependent hydrolase [Candidatus Rifleibacterium amylolyticum]|nr:MAG: putative metal-dependent hydrolase [Candidatus Rifleibacterium amylolyticum]